MLRAKDLVETIDLKSEEKNHWNNGVSDSNSSSIKQESADSNPDLEVETVDIDFDAYAKEDETEFTPSGQSAVSLFRLIKEIEDRPALYDNNLKEYWDMTLKKLMWQEVCETVVPGWNHLDFKKKIRQGREVQKKWANLRTCFRREWNAQKDAKSDLLVGKKRKYVYYDKLLFLLPFMDNRQPTGNLGLTDDQEDCNADDIDSESNSTTVKIHTPRKRRANDSNKGAKDVETRLKVSPTDLDEDTNFALSLVPSLQNLTPDEKLDAKINILQVFKQIRQARHPRAKKS